MPKQPKFRFYYLFYYICHSNSL